MLDALVRKSVIDYAINIHRAEKRIKVEKEEVTKFWKELDDAYKA